MLKKLLMIFIILLLSISNFAFSQFEATNLTAHFTNEVQTLEDDSTTVFRKVEIVIENLDSLAIHGFMVEVLEVDSEYILSRITGNKYISSNMGFIEFINDKYYIDAGYFNQSTALNLFIRFENYEKITSDLYTLTLMPYED